MADTIIKSAIRGRIAAALVGIGAAWLASRYGYTLAPDDTVMANQAISEIIGTIGAWIGSAASLGLAWMSKKRESK